MGGNGNVITDRSAHLFYDQRLTLDTSHTDQVIDVVRRFAAEKKMQFLLARESLPPGDLNVSANSRELNIKAMHTGAVGDTGFRIFAISRKPPTDADRASVEELVHMLQNIPST